MIKVENIDVLNIEGAIRGMRNPLASHNKSDSQWKIFGGKYPKLAEAEYVIGENDLDLMRRLYKAGNEHRKYLRQIFVSMDITAPTMWWLQFDTYKIGVTTNSYSKMHKLHSKPITIDDFSFDDSDAELGDKGISLKDCFINVVADCEMLRQLYNKTGDKKYWDGMVRLLPESYNQKRTVTMNYENVINIIKQRTGHKVSEWNDFIVVLKDLPYIKEIMGD